MADRPARWTTKLPERAVGVEVAATGDVYVFGRSQLSIHRWATGKTERRAWPDAVFDAVLLGDDAIAEIDHRQAMVVDRAALDRRDLPDRVGAFRSYRLVGCRRWRAFPW